MKETVVLAGTTTTKRVSLAELHTDEETGEEWVCTKVFRPTPDGFREDFPTQTSGLFPGGAWELLPCKSDRHDADGTDHLGVLFTTQAYTLPFALWLTAALLAALKESGKLEEVMKQVSLLSGENDELPISDFLEVVVQGGAAPEQSEQESSP